MINQTEIGLDFIIDKLTNSIENVITGDSFATDISILTANDLKAKVGISTVEMNLKIQSEIFTNSLL